MLLEEKLKIEIDVFGKVLHVETTKTALRQPNPIFMEPILGKVKDVTWEKHALFHERQEEEIVVEHPDLREYQKRIVKGSLARNTLIVLPTGTGKTRIMLETIRKLEARTIIIAPKIVIVDQIVKVSREYFMQMCPNWQITHMSKQGKSYGGSQIIIGTPSSMQEVNLQHFDCLMMDEAHNCRGDSVMRNIALMAAGLGLRIYGYTASPSFSIKISKVHKEIAQYQEDTKTHNLLALTEEEEEECKTMGLIKCPSILTNSVDITEVPLNDYIDMLAMQQTSVFCAWVYEDYVKWLGDYNESTKEDIPILAIKENHDLFLKKLQSATGVMNIYSHNLRARISNLLAKYKYIGENDKELVMIYMISVMLTCINVNRLRGDCHDQLVTTFYRQHLLNVDRTCPFVNDDHNRSLDSLLSIILMSQSKHAIVFCTSKATCNMLCSVLWHQLIRIYNIVKCTVGGSENKYFKEDIVEIVTRIKRTGVSFLLFSTAVLEEGMDVSNVDLIVNFDPIRNLVSHVQSKGRARASNSQHFEMSTRDQDKPTFEDTHQEMMDSIRRHSDQGVSGLNVQPSQRSLENRMHLVKIILSSVSAATNPAMAFNEIKQKYNLLVEIEWQMVNGFTAYLRFMGHEASGTASSKKSALSIAYLRLRDVILEEVNLD
jgi:ERCC4-related helicase